MEYANSESVGIDTNTISRDIGIHSVLQAEDDMLWSDMATVAAEDCLASVPQYRDKIDMIIYAGIDGDFKEPSTAHFIQRKLKINNFAPAIDVSNACQGFLSAIIMANALIRNGDAKYILVVTADKGTMLGKMVADELSKGVSRKYFLDKMGVFTVGDAGGAVLLGPSRSADRGFQMFNTSSRGRHASLCTYGIKNGIVDGQMKMAQITGVTLKEHKRQIPVTAKALNWVAEEIDCLMTHQVGDQPFRRLSTISGVSSQKMSKTFTRYGNLTTATFSVNLKLAVKEKLITHGSKVLGMFSGSGITIAHFGYRHTEGI